MDFPPISTNSNTIPLRMMVRPIRPVRSNVVVDVSLFLVKKESISKHLDTKTILPIQNEAENGAVGNSGPLRPTIRLNAPKVFHISRDKMFQPQPVAFSLMSQPSSEQNVVLSHEFCRDQLEHPPEIPSISFGPHFTNPHRPMHTVRLAIITKPRFRSQNDSGSELQENNQDCGCPIDDTLPILG
uniref:Uncharacterized protein n=1 Tax=Ciona savignyi TaxID=51511 RepID=H2ZGJ6_CIOSA